MFSGADAGQARALLHRDRLPNKKSEELQ
jgi:hypothetical protein